MSIAYFYKINGNSIEEVLKNTLICFSKSEGVVFNYEKCIRIYQEKDYLRVFMWPLSDKKFNYNYDKIEYLNQDSILIYYTLVSQSMCNVYTCSMENNEHVLKKII